MSPDSPCRRRARLRPLRKGRTLALLTATALLAAAGPAAAAPTHYTGTDPSNDSKGNDSSQEILGATADYDSSDGSASLTLTLASSPATKNWAVAARFGSTVGATCSPDADESGNGGDPGDVVIMTSANIAAQGLTLNFYNRPSTGASGYLDPAPKYGTTMTLSIPANTDTAGLSFNCVRIDTQMLTEGADSSTADEMVLSLSTGTVATPTPTPVVTPTPIVTTEPDADGDGVSDAEDTCPKVAGAAKNGCPAIAAKLEFRLGAKRVVFDHMAKLTAKVCPAKAAAIVTVGKKRYGKQVVTVETHGSYCYVKGVVKLKKRAKKVKLVVKGTGMSQVATTIKR